MIPLYYARNEQGISPGWVEKSKRAMATVVPRFNMRRVLENYLHGLYRPAARRAREILGTDASGARELARWKQRIAQAWPKVELRPVAEAPRRLQFGQRVTVDIGAVLNGLDPEDVRVELVVQRELPPGATEEPPVLFVRAARERPRR